MNALPAVLFAQRLFLVLWSLNPLNILYYLLSSETKVQLRTRVAMVGVLVAALIYNPEGKDTVLAVAKQLKADYAELFEERSLEEVVTLLEAQLEISLDFIELYWNWIRKKAKE